MKGRVQEGRGRGERRKREICGEKKREREIEGKMLIHWCTAVLFARC
jgi:hypothetical protein